MEKDKTRKRILHCQVQFSILNRMVRVDLLEKVTSE